MTGRASVLLGVLLSYAETEAEQQKCTEMVLKAEADGAPPEEVEKVLVYSLADGLRYGNWPWWV
jgi:hypothetical protein